MNANGREVKMKSVKRETLAKQVVDQIVELLRSGVLRPGDKLPPENELTETLFVSRPVLREALSSLETMGIIERKTREGTFFTSQVGSKPYSIMFALSSGDMAAVIEARMSLELGLVSIAAEKITDEQLSKLEENLKLMAVTKEHYGDLDKDFHRTIAYCANNSVLEGIIDPLLDLFDQTYTHVLMEDRSHEKTIKEHRMILEALKKRDPMESFFAMRKHLETTRNKIRNYLKEIQKG